MGGNWRGLVVVWALFVGSALSLSVVSKEDEGQELQERADEVGATVESHRDDRVFLVFAQVQPVQCTSNDSSGSSGTCLTSGDCTNRGGTASGSCANGLGVCCLITRSCNQETTINNTYFRQPDAASSTLGACSITVNRINKNICQIRLDFLQHDLSQPDSDGACSQDFMSVSGGISNAPRVCGSMTGQHMYFDLDPNGGAVKVTVDRASAASLSAAWNIRVSQIACDSKYRAPVGCLQYYTETTNSVKSFNFDGVAESHGTQQLAGLEYAVCIRRADNYCGITWSADKSDPDCFTMTDNVKVLEESTLGSSYVSTRGGDCTTDFVVIPGGLYTTEANGNLALHSDRYCGLGFPDTVTSTAQPFSLYVKSDANENMDRYNRGFSLIYRQTPCG